MNFVGNIEGKDIPLGNVDIAVCDGYVGNVMLKFLEGTGSFFTGFLKGMFTKNIFSKISTLFVMKDMKAFKQMIDPSEDGGAPVLGVDGLVIKSHGNSDEKTIRNVIFKTLNLAGSSVFDEIRNSVEKMEVAIDGEKAKRERKRWHFRYRKLRPRKILTNSDLEKMVDTSDEWIIREPAFQKKDIRKDTPIYTLAVETAKQAIKDSGISPDQ